MLKSKLVLNFPHHQLQASLRDSTKVAIEVYTAVSLPIRIKTWIWDLYEKNMESLLSSSEEGFDPFAKRKELFHAESRIVVLRAMDQSPIATSSEDLVGFSIFRFDTETAHDTRLADVLYCYELQIDPSRRRTGAAKLLMDCLARIAKDWRMDKVMLTCLKSNQEALAFYESQGYINDEIDPSFSRPEVDYRILSRVV
ncbi:BQ2448_651 [Microbotryum intermedium]|uniref:N-alpha-acetyltransferase 40 n=1 Tax=Microbotryum intermedium TaxID=269621 RepID=A0A238F314_9BASI|nr:BQ2448_651 [Microbotryum intermedium]